MIISSPLVQGGVLPPSAEGGLVFGFWFVMSPHSWQLNYDRDAYKWCAVIRGGFGVTFFSFGVVSTQLAFRVQPKRTQVEAQYWGNPTVARLEGTPARLI